MQEKLEKRRQVFWISDMEAVIVIFIVLLVLGTINIFSSSFVFGETEFQSPYFFLIKQGINLVAGGICFIIAALVNYHRWHDWMLLILGLTIFALILVLFIGTEVNGAQRWLGYGSLQIQPAEIAKVVAIMLVSAYASHCVSRNQPINLINPQTVIILFMGILIEKEPDAGTMAIVVAIPYFLLCIAGLGREKILLSFMAALVAGVGLVFLQPYRLERVKVLLDPWADAQGVGYQTVQSLIAIGSGGFTGMGFGMGVSKYSYLPEAHTDFAFAILGQETGFFGVTLVLLLFAAFTVYAARIANAAVDAYGQFLASGIVLLIIGQAIVNLLMVAGLLPVIGVPLPFISYGGTSLMVCMGAVGILLNIGYHSANAKKKKEKAEREKLLLAEQVAKKEHLRLVK